MTTYYNRGRSGYRRSSARSGAGSRWMALRYAGACKVCGAALAAGTRAYWDSAAKTVTCERIECARADGLTERAGHWAGNPDGIETLRASRVGAGAASSDPFARTRSRGYYGMDAGRCEDAPCCGCCT